MDIDATTTLIAAAFLAGVVFATRFFLRAKVRKKKGDEE